jgi:hypothetical protein
VNFRTPGRVDVEPPSVADSLRECTASSPRAWQAAVDVDVVDDLEDEVVDVFFSGLSEQLLVMRRYILPRFDELSSSNTGSIGFFIISQPHTP